MTYMNPNDRLKRGYNVYIDADTDDLGTQMDVGLLLMEAGDEYVIEEPEKECAVLLFAGAVEIVWNGETCAAKRPDCFRYEAYCLLAPRRTRITLRAKEHSELYIQKTVNERDYEPVMFTPETVQTQHAGANGELMGAMRREIKTFFDYDNAPFSNMVLGEVLNYPGKWSSYPPHHHPQPEVYFYRFDYPQGFGAGFANGQIYETQRHERHHIRLPLPGHRAGLRHVLRLGHPPSGRRPMEEDPDRRSGARLALAAGRQRPYFQRLRR